MARGLWSLSPVQKVDGLPQDVSGFRVVRGKVIRVGESQRSLWLNLQGGLALRIDKRDLKRFRTLDKSRLTGRRLEARGWIYRHNGKRTMQVRHPSAIDFL